MTEDGGETYTRHYGGKKIRSPYDETMAYRRADGSIRMLARTFGPVLAESFSFDEGLTWTDAVPTDIPDPSSRFFVSRTPTGRLLLVHHGIAEGHTRRALTVSLSEDDGKTWHHLSELMPCFWGKLFLHMGDVYMLGCSTEYGDLLIGRSTDGGKTFSAPVTLLRGSNGKAGHCGVHKNPQPIFRHNGRIYESLEWGAWANKEFCHAAMVMSCDENADLLNPESWHFTPPRKFDHFVPELAELPKTTQTIEGTLVLSPEGELLNIMRFGMHGKVLAYRVDTEDPDAPLTFHSLIDIIKPVSGLVNAEGMIFSRLKAPWTNVQELIEYAKANGLPLFDFMGAGKPDANYGVRDFKKEFGGEVVEHGRFLCVRKPILYAIGKLGVKWLKRCRCRA